MKIPIVSERMDEVRVSFKHHLSKDDDQKLFTNNGLGTLATIAWTTKDGNERVHIGVARVHPNDAPERKIGKKIALARALRESGLPKDERRQVWMGLLERGMRV